MKVPAGWARCKGSGISIPVARTTRRCIVLIDPAKPSGLCEFCSRTER